MKFLFTLLIALFALTGHAQEGFIVTRYDFTINVNKDTTVDITEKIEADFTQKKHGIYRNILLTGDMKISEIRVDSAKFTTDISNSNAYIRIGDPAVLIKGKQRFVLHYKLTDVIYFTDDGRAVLKYNLLGTEWKVPVKDINFDIRLFRPSAMEHSFSSSCLPENLKGYETLVNWNDDNTRLLGSAFGKYGKGTGFMIKLMLNSGFFTPPSTTK